MPSFHFWDIVLIVAVSLQTAALAYLHHPRHKALIYALPVPFTVAALAVGKPVNTLNVAGIFLLFCYANCVRILYNRLGMPIVPAILCGLALFSGLALTLTKILPTDERSFWIAIALSFICGIAILRLMPARIEPGHRTPLPIWIKLPIIVAVVVTVVILKARLQGFMTLFPMVGVVGAYEARHSLWTLSRQVSVIMLTVGPMILACYLVQKEHGLPTALAAGWLAYGVSLTIVMQWMKREAAFIQQPAPA